MIEPFWFADDDAIEPLRFVDDGSIKGLRFVDENDDHSVVGQLRREVSLGAAARQGAAWIGAARVIVQLTQFVTSLVLARLLLPGQFGQAAIAMAVAGFGQLFTDLGLSAAVVHARKATPQLLATAFWLNLISGFALTALVIIVAYPVAKLFHQPALAGLMVIASLNFTLSCGIVQTALLERTFNYRRLAIYESSAYIAGAFVGPVFAACGIGTPSLLWGQVLTSALLSATLWLLVPWRPTHRPSLSAAGQLWRYSRGLIGFNAVNYWSRNIDTVVLGARVSTHALGDYTRAFNLTMIPLQQMNVVLGRVLFPSLTRMRSDRRRMARAWLRAVTVTGSVILPVTVTLAAAAPALIYVLLGPRWEGAATNLELLALATTPQVVATAGGGLFRAAGATATMFRVGMVSTVVSVMAIFAGLPWGTVGVCATILAVSSLTLPLILVPISRITGIRFAEAVRALAPMVPPAAALGAGELSVRLLAPAGATPYLVLPAQLIAGFTLYVPSLFASNREAFLLFDRIVRGAFVRLNTSRSRRK